MESTPLRIAMLGHKRIPSREGGVEVVVEAIATRMAAQGHRVTCYNRRGRHVSGAQHGTAPLKQFQGVRLIAVPTLDRRGLAAISAACFAAVRAAFGRYDVVHFHAEGPCIMIWLPKLLGKRCIATIHGLDHQRAKWGRFAGATLRMGERMAARHADEIIVLSRNVQAYFRTTYGRSTHYIPNGCTLPTHRPADAITRAFGLAGRDYLLYLGRLVPEKGIDCLVDAFRLTQTPLKLVIAGGASDTDAFLRQLKARAAGDARIIFTGFVQGQLLEELYSNPYAYVLPSEVEGMPLSLLEAMSYGNCCLTSDIPECTEATGGMALTFACRSVSDLAEKLQMLCDVPVVVEHYRACAAGHVIAQYCWEDIVRRTLALYRTPSPSRKGGFL
ncbi:MAG: glycosyltransferase family 4 protein [Candidatus Limiplasma sp.]|nr:glycosyltransferase family 4 protein [Candidatus Limiplasma sp.]